MNFGDRYYATVKMRREGFPPVTPQGDMLDGCRFLFECVGKVDEELNTLYHGEDQMQMLDANNNYVWWLASGDLVDMTAAGNRYK